MDPNQSAPTPASSPSNTSSTPDIQAQDIQQPVNQYQPAASTAATSQSTTDQPQQEANTHPKPADGKNWLEYAGLQKVVDQLPQGVRDIVPNSVEQFNKLSTTQKIAGAVALAGIGYLALRPGKAGSKGQPEDSGRAYRGGNAYQPTSQPWGSANREYGNGTRSDESKRTDRDPGYWNENSRNTPTSSTAASSQTSANRYGTGNQYSGYQDTITNRTLDTDVDNGV